MLKRILGWLGPPTYEVREDDEFRIVTPTKKPAKNNKDDIRPPVKEMVRYYQRKSNRNLWSLEMLSKLYGTNTIEQIWELKDEINDVTLRMTKDRMYLFGTQDIVSYSASSTQGLHLSDAEAKYVYQGIVDRFMKVKYRHARFKQYVQDKQERERLTKIYRGTHEG